MTAYSDGSIDLTFPNIIRKAKHYHKDSQDVKFDDLFKLLRYTVFPIINEHFDHIHEPGSNDHGWTNITKALQINQPSIITNLKINFRMIDNSEVQSLTNSVTLSIPDRFEDIKLYNGMFITISANVKEEGNEEVEVRERVLVGFRFQYESKTIMFIRNYKIGRQLEFVSARSAEITQALAVFLERVYSQNPFIGGDASGNSNS